MVLSAGDPYLLNPESDQDWTSFLLEKFCDQKLHFISSKASMKDFKATALQREHTTLQNLKFLPFLWVILACLDSDTQTPIAPNPVLLCDT
jgi:hypothetical protein